MVLLVFYRVWDMETAGEFRIRKGFEGREDESEYLISIETFVGVD